MVEKYAKWIVRRPITTIVISLAVCLVAAAGGQNLSFENDFRMFFSEDNPQLKAFEELQSTYTKSDNVLFVIAPKNGRVFERDVLSAIEDLTERAWHTPYSSRVDSITNFQHSSAAGDDLVIDDLVRDAASMDAERIARIRKVALEDPLLVRRLISPRGDVTGINVTVQLPGVNDVEEVPAVAGFAREMAESARARYSNLDVHVTGQVMMNAAFSEGSERDIKTLVPVMLLVVVLTMGLLLRSVSGTLTSLLVIFLSIFGALGLAGWCGIALSPTSVASPNIIMTLAVAYCVHLLASFFHGLGAGMSRPTAVVESVRVNFQPLFLAGLTTMIGFLTLNFSDAPPFRDLGNITAVGVVASFLLSVSFLPAMMVLLPVRARRRGEAAGRVMAWLADLVIRRRERVFWATVSVAAAMIAFIPANELNDEYVKYFDDSFEFRRATDFTTDRLTGIYSIDYSLDSGRSEGISDPDFLATVDEFAEWYRNQPSVLHVFSVTDVLKRLNQNLHGDDPRAYRLPEQNDLSAQYLFLYEMSLPYGLDLNDRINQDKSATRVTVTMDSLSSNEVIALEGRAQEWLRTHAPALQGTGSGLTVMFAHIGQRNIESMLTGIALALVGVSLVLIFALRSWKIGLVSLVPNLVPAAMGFGLWGFVVGQVGLALSVVAAMTLGVVVDDTVHFLSKYLRARREKGLNPEEAVRYAFSTVGTAIWVTSLVLMAGFGVLSFSGFEINSGMGLLTAVVIALALVADFLLLPTLLLKIEERKSETATTYFAVADSRSQ